MISETASWCVIYSRLIVPALQWSEAYFFLGGRKESRESKLMDANKLAPDLPRKVRAEGRRGKNENSSPRCHVDKRRLPRPAFLRRAWRNRETLPGWKINTCDFVSSPCLGTSRLSPRRSLFPPATHFSLKIISNQTLMPSFFEVCVRLCRFRKEFHPFQRENKI